MLHKLGNKIKANAKSSYSNIGGGAHIHLGLVLTDLKYVLIYPTPFVHSTHPDPLFTPDGTTARAISNMRITHTKEVRMFYEVTGVEQALTQQIVCTVKKVYLADIRNRTTNSINDIMLGVLTHLQENYGQLMPQNLLERKDIVKMTNYNPHKPILTMFCAVDELLKFPDITGMAYTQLQSVHITYEIVQRTSKFGLKICEWNCMPEI